MNEGKKNIIINKLTEKNYYFPKSQIILVMRLAGVTLNYSYRALTMLEIRDVFAIC